MMAGFAAPQAATALHDALRPAGFTAAHIGTLWNATLALCTLVFAAIMVALLVALRRAPRSDAATAPDVASLAQPERRTWRRIAWAVAACAVGLLALLAADVFTTRALARLPLADAVNIELTGHDWWWEAHYHDADAAHAFDTANEFAIPVGRPVIVTLKSDDVIHSLWVPNLAGKKDLIPGRTATLQLRADRPGAYRGQCAEFCGLEHALMALVVHALPPAEYEAWAAHQRQGAAAPAEALARRGRALFEQNNCAACHTIKGTPAHGQRGPDLTHLAARTTIAAGMYPNDPGHLASWIADPHTMKPGVNMPPAALSPADLKAVLAYLETLK